MCRNIRTLFTFEPPATEDEIRASALQFVRKLSGFTHPSKANEAAFERAVNEVSDVARRLLRSLETAAPARNREIDAMRARERRDAHTELGATPARGRARARAARGKRPPLGGDSFLGFHRIAQAEDAARVVVEQLL